VTVVESTAADVVTRSILKAVATTADAGLLSDQAAKAAAEGMAIELLRDALTGVPEHERWALLLPRAALLRDFIGTLDG
jgi:hypothetical protein